jgi:hypothetical protein
VRPEGLGKLKKSPHRALNPLPSSSEHSALTTTLPRAPISNTQITFYNVVAALVKKETAEMSF